ncbi:hypothetical protein BGX28_001180, partial [Mortierella sp. GBA30]
ALMGSYTCDGWSSHDRKFIGFTFHYLERDFTPRSVAIGLEEYETQINVLEKWRLRDKVVCGTTDQGANVKAAARNLASADETLNQVSWTPCVAHKMQLCVKKALTNASGAQNLLENIQNYRVPPDAFRKHVYEKAQKALDGQAGLKAV